MFIIEVIPLAKLPPQAPQLLSYFLDKKLSKGAVVEVLMNSRKIQAVVVGCSSVENQKISLKKSSFQLKKISSIISETPLVTERQLKLALWLAKNYFAPLGLCLKTVLPPFFLKKNYKIQAVSQVSDKNGITNQSKPLVILSRAKDIIKNIEPKIKSILKKKGKSFDSAPYSDKSSEGRQGKQVLIIVPEISVAKYFYDYFAGYYESAIVYGSMGIRQYKIFWDSIGSGETEIIVGTKQALFAPFKNLGLIIVEDPSNGAYKSDMSPKYNASELVSYASIIYMCPLVFISQVPDVKSYSLIEDGEYESSSYKNFHKPDIKLYDMVQEIKSGNYSIFSKKLKDFLVDYAKKDKKILMFSSRKGFSSALICENCGFNFKCSNCSIPLRLHKSTEKLFVCNRCSDVRKVPKECPNCHSYKLKAVGFPGTQKIAEELARLLDYSGIKKEVFIFDSSYVKTEKAEREILQNMDKHESYICIATQAIFSYRYDHKFDLIAVINADSLTVFPDFRSDEQLFYQFEKLLDFDPDKVIIQAYNSESLVLNKLVEKDYKDFYDEELPLRRLLSYPPFIRLIKLSFKHSNKQKAQSEASTLSSKLKMAILRRGLEGEVKILGPSPAFVEKEGGRYIFNIILKISKDKAPDEILRFVPSHWSIDVDPRSIL